MNLSAQRGNSVHWGINPPLPSKTPLPSFLPTPPLKSANCASLPHFLGNLPLYIDFSGPPPPPFHLKVASPSGTYSKITKK